MFLGPQMYLILALALAGPATYGYMKIKQYRIETAAYAAGQRVGAGVVAAATTEKSTAVVAAVTEGEALAPFVSVDKMAIQELCKKSASCRERKRP